jgi:hypothetical protein
VTAGSATGTELPQLQQELLSVPVSWAWRPQFRPFSSLDTVRSEPDWLWEGFLATGQVTMLVGDAFTGKSTLVSGLLGAMECGDSFLGRATTKSTALLLSEETDQQLAEKARCFGLLRSRHSVLTRSDGISRSEWEPLIDQATRHALDQGHRLLIIDTFPHLAGLEPEEENDSAAITKRLRPLLAAAGEGLAVLFLHHTNKGGGVRGSQAFRGVVDISIHLARRKHENTIRLSAESRYTGADSGKLIARLHKRPERWMYQAQGAPTSPPSTSARGGTTRTRLLEAVTDAGPEGITYNELGRLPGLSKDKAKRHLPRMREEGLVEPDGDGTKTDNYRWKVKEPSREPLIRAEAGDAIAA